MSHYFEEEKPKYRGIIYNVVSTVGVMIVRL